MEGAPVRRALWRGALLGLLVVGVLAAVSAAARPRVHPRATRHRPAPRLLRQPSAAHPLTLLEIGDSLGEDLGMGLQAVLAGHRDVRLLARAVGDTGLANVAYYNWPAVLEQDLRAYHPGLVVVFIGGNDAQGFDVGARPAFFGSSFWHQAYSARVATVLREAHAAHAALLWVGMPIMGSPAFSRDMAMLNAIYASEVAHDPFARYLSTWRLFSNSAGAYAQYLPGPGGTLVEVRDSDGVHIAPSAGTDRVAAAVVRAINQDFRVRI